MQSRVICHNFLYALAVKIDFQQRVVAHRRYLHDGAVLENLVANPFAGREDGGLGICNLLLAKTRQLVVSRVLFYSRL